MEKQYNFPVFATQNNELVREIETIEGTKCIFVEAPPEGMGLTVGNFMPEEWDTIPANSQARESIEEEQFGHDEIDDLFDRASAEYLHRGPEARPLHWLHWATAYE